MTTPFPQDSYGKKDDKAKSLFPNFHLEDSEQTNIVSLCNQFKKSAQHHAQEKKKTLQTCYAYAKSQFVGGDLLPTPSTEGNERDINKQRPQIFVPLIRQQLKQLYSSLKLTIFPNDTDFFRVRGKTSEAAALEEALTEGLKYKFREGLISEKIGGFLYNLCWAGNAAILPTIRDEVVWEWQFDSETQEYVALQKDTPPLPDVEVLNPIDFYIDPNETDSERAKWGYFSTKKIQEIKDSTLYFNKDRLDTLAKTTARRNQNHQNLDLSGFNGLNASFQDSDEHIDYDLYYFPYLKTTSREYRNMLIGVAGEKTLIRFHPNLFTKGLNPVVFCNWMPDVDTQYGTGPIEDIKELQRLINILYNYMIEVMARIGNRFKVTEGVDLSNLFGIAGGVATVPPGGNIEAFTGDYAEPSFISNIIGTAKAEAQITAGGQQPFQGMSNIDFKKTATELQILQENSISVLREVIEHVTNTGIQRIMERLMHLCADLYPYPVSVRVDDMQKGTHYIDVDLSVLKSGDYTIELVSVNPSQSKMAQVNGLTELLDIIAGKPDVLFIGEPIIRKIGELQGVKDVQSLMNELKQKLMEFRNGQTKSGVPNPEAPVGTSPQPSMDRDNGSPFRTEN